MRVSWSVLGGESAEVPRGRAKWHTLRFDVSDRIVGELRRAALLSNRRVSHIVIRAVCGALGWSAEEADREIAMVGASRREAYHARSAEVRRVEATRVPLVPSVDDGLVFADREKRYQPRARLRFKCRKCLAPFDVTATKRGYVRSTTCPAHRGPYVGSFFDCPRCQRRVRSWVGYRRGFVCRECLRVVNPKAAARFDPVAQREAAERVVRAGHLQ